MDHDSAYEAALGRGMAALHAGEPFWLPQPSDPPVPWRLLISPPGRQVQLVFCEGLEFRPQPAQSLFPIEGLVLVAPAEFGGGVRAGIWFDGDRVSGHVGERRGAGMDVPWRGAETADHAYAWLAWQIVTRMLARSVDALQRIGVAAARDGA